MEIKKVLETEILSEIEGLKDLEVGSEKYKVAVDGIAKLTDRAIELEKVDIDCANKDVDYYWKEQMNKDEIKDKKIRNGIAIAGIIIPTAVTIWGTLKTFKFEETGTVTTILGRGFFNKLLPKK